MFKSKSFTFLKLFLIFLLLIIYLEFVFRARVFTVKFDSNLLRMLSFSFSYSVLILFFLMFFTEKTARRLFFVTAGILTYTYFNQEVYHSVVNGYYSFSISGGFLQAASFYANYFQAFEFGQLFYFLPLISFFLINKYTYKFNFSIQYYAIKQPLVVLFIGFGAYLATVSSISSVNPVQVEGVDMFTDRDLYNDLYSADAAIYKFGMLTYSQRDLLSLFHYNKVDEDLQMLEIDDFLSKQPDHELSYYSNQLEDKNFILIMAESLDTYAIVPELTPMLQEVKDNSLYFENYYSPLYYRNTADTEFLVQTGLYPNKNVSLSMEVYMDNYFPNTMARLFSSYTNVDYETFSFHNYTDYFYPRTDFHTQTLGFDHYFGSVQLGLQDEPSSFVLNHEWQSDILLMEKVIDIIFDDMYTYDKFYANILTVSGHLDYDSKHTIASTHYQQVEDYEEANGLDIPEDVKYYLASQIEFDLALTYLIDELKARGVFEDTVIMIFGDHYAYGLDVETIWEYDTIKEDGSNIDIHNVPMMIYNTGLENQVIPNYMSSIDVMPTIANLFSLDIHYNEIIGKDALDGDNNTVRFANLSFVNKDFSFDIIENDYILNENTTLTKDDAMILNNHLIKEYIVNNMILEIDYYRKKESLN
ncbi:MAG: LTA synthase family protein [Candidatus Izemoplasma sp.]